MNVRGGRLVLHWRASRLLIGAMLALLALALAPDAASIVSGLCAR